MADPGGPAMDNWSLFFQVTIRSQYLKDAGQAKSKCDPPGGCLGFHGSGFIPLTSSGGAGGRRGYSTGPRLASPDHGQGGCGLAVPSHTLDLKIVQSLELA